MNRAALISAAGDVLQQGIALLDNVDQESYSHKEEGAWGSSIGAHYRHILDHFLCLIEGLSAGQINYDHRGRNRGIETSIEIARSTTHDLFEALTAIPDGVLNEECTVVYSVGYGESEAQAVRSVVARELMFCVGHAIHHYAIVKLISDARVVTLPSQFGIAPSTLKHQAQAVG
jgi:hypothetical protein